MKEPDIEIICGWCSTHHFVKWCRDRKVIGFRIDFAVCPDCIIPNNIALYVQYRKQWKCGDCRVPVPFVTKKTDDECLACYMNHYRAVQVTTKAKVI